MMSRGVLMIIGYGGALLSVGLLLIGVITRRGPRTRALETDFAEADRHSDSG